MIFINLLKHNLFFGLFLIWFFFTFLLWLVLRDIKQEKKSFDFSVFGVLFVLILHRFLHFLFFYNQYRSNYWSWNPIAWVNGEKVLFGTKPWIMFSFWFGDFNLGLLLLSLIIVVYIIIRLNNFDYFKFFEVFSKTLFGTIPAFLIISYFQNFFIGYGLHTVFNINFLNWQISRHPVVLYLSLLWLAIFLLSVFIKGKSTEYNLFLFLWIIGFVLMIKVFSYNISTFMLNCLLVCSAIFLLNVIIPFLNKKCPFMFKKKKTRKNTSVSRF